MFRYYQVLCSGLNSELVKFKYDVLLLEAQIPMDSKDDDSKDSGIEMETSNSSENFLK